MNNCQRCGELVPPGVSRCPACGEPALYPAWLPEGAPAEPRNRDAGTGFASGGAGQRGEAAQPMQFSASDLISPESLPGWIMHEQGMPPSTNGQRPPAPPLSYQPQQPYQSQQPPALGWDGPQQTWNGAPLESLQTIRQPAVGPVSPTPPAFGVPAADWGQASQSLQPSPMPHQSPAHPQSFASSAQASVYQPASTYPVNAYPAGAYPGSAGAQPGGYQSAPGALNPVAPAQPALAPYDERAYQFHQQAPPPRPPEQSYMPPSAFPGVEQVGAYGAAPQSTGPGARDLLNQGALPSWLAGATPIAPPAPPQAFGMQARSLVDDQSLPEWLRQQPGERPRTSVAGWLGASATEEPLPSWVAPATPMTPKAPDTLGGRGLGAIQPFQAPQAAAPYTGEPQQNAGWLAQPPARLASDEAALPDWLHKQADARQESAPFVISPQPAPLMSPPDAGYASSQIPGRMGAEPITPAPDAPAWEAGARGDSAHLDTGWGEPQSWSGEPVEAQAEQRWDEMEGQGGPKRFTRGAPLAPDEMPSWLRRSVAGSDGLEAHSDAQRGGRSGRALPQRPAAGRREDEWDARPGGWNDESAGWRDGDPVYYDRADGWDDDAGARSPNGSTNEWDGGRSSQDEQWESRPGGRHGHDPYHGSSFDDGRGDQGYPDQRRGNQWDAGYDDGDEGYGGGAEEEQSQTGWRRFFHRDQ